MVILYGVIDRIEGKIAVVEFDQGDIKKIKLDDIKGKAKEGDILYKKENFYFIDIDETNKRRKEAEGFLELWD